MANVWRAHAQTMAHCGVAGGGGRAARPAAGNGL